MNLKIRSFLFLTYVLTPYLATAGTITISATGVTSSPIFVTSALASLTVGTQLNLGTFKDTTALGNIIASYKAGVVGVGIGNDNATATANAQADATAKKSQLYNDTITWLSSSANFIDLAAAANTISQTGTTSPGKFLFNASASRTVNGASSPYAGANGTMDVTYANYASGITSPKLWAWFATGNEVAIVTDTTWVVPTNNASGLTVGSANLVSTGSGDATELLLATYTDYSSGSDLISSLGISTSRLDITVIPEPSVGSMIILAVSCLAPLRRKLVQKTRGSS